jgi:hypothetical protein
MLLRICIVYPISIKKDRVIRSVCVVMVPGTMRRYTQRIFTSDEKVTKSLKVITHISSIQLLGKLTEAKIILVLLRSLLTYIIMLSPSVPERYDSFLLLPYGQDIFQNLYS